MTTPTPIVNNDKMVDHPPHYNQGNVECIDAIIAATGDGAQQYLQGNIIKYVWRYKHRHGLQDLKKAQWYLNYLIDLVHEQSPIDNTAELEKNIREKDRYFQQVSEEAWQVWSDAEMKKCPDSEVQLVHEIYTRAIKESHQFRIKHFKLFYPNELVPEGWGNKPPPNETEIVAQEEILYNKMSKAWHKWGKKDDVSLRDTYDQALHTWNKFRQIHDININRRS